METDEQLLIPKSLDALDKYGHDMVIANRLDTRKHHVLFIHKNKQVDVVALSEQEKQQGIEIEQNMITKIVHLHQHHLS